MDPESGPELPPEVAARVQALEEQLAAQPKAKALYLQLSQLLAEHGRKAEAIQALQRCLAVDPGNALVKHKLELLTHAGVATASATAGLHKPQAPRFVPRTAPERRRVPVWAWVAGGLVLLVAGVAAKLWLFPDARLVVADSFDATSPQWSPRGDRVAFLRGGTDLGLHDLRAGSTATVAKGVLGGFAWSPDGSRIAYAAEAGTGGSEEEEYGYALYVLDIGTKRATRVASGSNPSWAADGLRLALHCTGTPPEYEFSGDEPTIVRAGSPSGPCVVDVADGRPRMLPVGWVRELTFSPERPSLVYDAWADDAMEEAAAAAEPARPHLNAEGNDEFQQFAQDAVAGGPRNFGEASRDLGRRAEAYMYDQKKKAANASGSFFGTDVYVVPADGGNPTRLTQGGHSGGAHWTPDGRVLFGQDSPAGPQLMTMNPDGSDVKPVFSKPVMVPDPSKAFMTRDRKRVVFVAPVQVANQAIASIMSGESPSDLYVSRVGDPAPKRLENRHPFKQRFALSPDGKRIVYEVKNGTSGKSELWVMSL
jgi:dipeptidyl aminopeptidase/acylaminoacyl peptidase